MEKLINTYKIGDSVVTQYETGKGLVDVDGRAYVEVASFKNGVWTDTQMVEG